MNMAIENFLVAPCSIFIIVIILVTLNALKLFFHFFGDSGIPFMTTLTVFFSFNGYMWYGVLLIFILVAAKTGKFL